MRKQCVFLKYRIQLPFIRRHIRDILPVENHMPLALIQKSPENSQKCCFPASAGSQQCHKFILINIEIDSLQHQCTVKVLYDILKLYQLFLFHCLRLLKTAAVW